MRKAKLIAFAALLSLCGCTRTSHDVGIEGIREVGKVNVLYVGVAETMRMSSQSGNTSMLWLVRGGAFYQIDLKGMAFHKEGGTWVVELDPPEVYAVADMKRTKLHDARTSLGYTDKALQIYNDLLMKEPDAETLRKFIGPPLMWSGGCRPRPSWVRWSAPRRPSSGAGE